MSNKPTVRELDIALKELVKWNRFALHLPGIKDYYIQTIESDNHGDIQGQKMALYGKWLGANPDASWDDVAYALETAEEITIAKKIRDNYSVVKKMTLFSSPMSPAADQSLSTAHPPKEVTVTEDVSTELERLETSFNDLRREVASEVKANIRNNAMQIDTLKQEISNQKAFSIPSLEAVTTVDGLFTTICPYYNFLSCHLIIVIATELLLGKIAIKAEEYKETLQSFKRSTKVRYLKNELQRHNRFRSSISTKVRIVVEDCWGEQSLGLVEILVKTLFPVKNSDELPWYEVTSGSLVMTFMALDHMTSTLIEYSMEKASFMSLVGVVSLSIGDQLVWERGKMSCSFLCFDDCLIQAALANKVEVVAFLLNHTTVNVNATSESRILVNVSEEIFYTKSEAEHALEEDYNAFSKLLEDIEYYSPPVQSESIFQIIFLKNFLNERVLSEQSLSEQLPQHLLHKVESYKHAITLSKKQIVVKFLANVINKYVPHELPNYEKVVLTLHSVWGDCSIQYIEQLGELIFPPSFFQEAQLANVQTNDALILTFLAPVHTVLQSIKGQFTFYWNCSDVIDILPFLGVVSIKVADSTVYTKYTEENFSWYSFSQALTLAEESLAPLKAEKVKKAIELMKQINKMPKEFKDIFSADENGNYGCLLHPGATALIIACCNDNINLVRLLLEHNADPNIHGRSTLTPLMYSSGNMQIFKMLIDHGADIDTLGFYNETVLHRACVVGNMQIVKYVLVQRENTIHKANKNGLTPFYYACEYGHVAIVNQLIKAKVDPNTQSSVTGWTGLMEASYHGHEAIVKRLVSLKVIDLNLRNNDEATALMLASTEGYTGIVELLLEHHCDPNLRDKAGDTAFSLSCAFGHKKILEALLIYDDLLNAQNLEGRTALANACCTGHSEVVKWLLEKLADPNISDSQGETPLTLAAYYGHINNVEQLLQIDSLNVNVQSANGDTALMEASRQGHSDIVEMLLQKAGADPSIQNTDGWTAIMIASFEGDIAIVKQLIKVTPNEDLEIRNNWGETAAFIACMHGHVEIVKLFIQETTVELDLQDNNGWTPLMSASKRGNAIVDLLLQKNTNPNQRENASGATVLMIATIHGRVQTVEQLLKHNADPCLQDKNGWTALMYASDKGHAEIVKQLLQSIEGKASIDFQNNDGSTALILANASSHVTIVNYILEQKADPNIQDKQGMTALMKAVCKDQQQAVEWLLESKADPNIQDNEGQTALWMASKMGGSIIVECLLSKNGDPNIRDRKIGSTPLMMAIGNCHPKVVRKLLDSKADPNTQDNTGETPLILAVKLNCPEIVEWLLQKEVDPNIQHTITGRTALLIASRFGYINVAQQLLQYKADLNIQDKVLGETALIAASTCGYMDLVDCLLQAKADPNIRNTFQGQTALMIPSAMHWIPMVKKLLQYKADPNIQNDVGETPLMKACYVRSVRQIEVVECLLQAKADPNITNSKGETALILASARYSCNPNIIRRLLQENVALNIQENTKRHTVLMAACDIPTVAVEDNVEVVKCLLEKKAEVNLQDIQGQTALMIATQHCNGEIIKHLIRSQADPNIPNNEGRTPLLDAVTFDRIDIVRSLLKNNADPNIEDNEGRSAMGIAKKYNFKRYLNMFQRTT